FTASHETPRARRFSPIGGVPLAPLVPALSLDSRLQSIRKLGKPQTEPLALEAEFARVVLAALERLESAATKVAVRQASDLTSDAKDDDLRDLRGAFSVPSETVSELVGKLNQHNARQVRRSIGLVAPEMTPKRLKAIAKR